jgi:hypothetical protein
MPGANLRNLGLIALLFAIGVAGLLIATDVSWVGYPSPEVAFQFLGWTCVFTWLLVSALAQNARAEMKKSDDRMQYLTRRLAEQDDRIRAMEQLLAAQGRPALRDSDTGVKATT